MTATPNTYLLPVGHDQGPCTQRPGEPLRFQVRVGARIAELDNQRFAVWLLAHDGDDALPDRDRLTDAAVQLGMGRDQVSTALDSLLGDGLLAEVGDTASTRSFAETHQLMPLMVGLGPDSEDDDLQVVGLLEIPVVQVSAAMYDLWMWAHLEPSLWHACDSAAALARDAGRTDADEVEPDRVLAGVLSAIHPLLASRAAFLDITATLPSERTVAA